MAEGNLISEPLLLLFEESKVTFSMPFSNLNYKTFQALFDYASIGILITNSKGDIQSTNKYIEYQFGYNESELMGQKIETLIPARYRDAHKTHRNNYIGDPHSRPMGLGMDLAGLKKNGAEFPVEVSLGHYTVEGEQFALAFITDITQRIESQQAVQLLNTHLEEKVKEGSQSLALTVAQLSAQIQVAERKDMELQRLNAFLNNIWNHAGAIIIVCDSDGLIQFLNPAAEKGLGHSASEVVNIHPITLFHDLGELNEMVEVLSPDFNKTHRTEFELLTELAKLNGGNSLELHYVKKGGGAFFVSLDIRPLEENGSITGYLAIAIDISEKKIAESELLAALDKEKDLSELKSRFVSMASHEFRTPLSAVLSSAYLLSKYTTTEEQVQRDKHIQRIVSSVSSLTEILNDFLSVGKIEEGDVHPHYIQYNIKKQMADAIQDVQHLLKDGQKIIYSHAGREEVYFDASMMKHIVTNLLSNAVKFSNDDCLIELSTVSEQAFFSLSVKDSGIGIPKADIDNLYKRFFRSSNATNIQGTGLGLHIVNKYAELMGGNVECISELGKGTEFKITFDNTKHK